MPAAEFAGIVGCRGLVALVIAIDLTHRCRAPASQERPSPDSHLDPDNLYPSPRHRELRRPFLEV